MNKKTILTVMVLAIVAVVTSFSVNAVAVDGKLPGLVGVQYGSEDFSEIQDLTRLSSLERKFTQDDGYGRQWAARWFGIIVGPANGEVAFSGEADQETEMRIGGRTIISTKSGVTVGSVSMVKGQEYPIEVSLVKGGQADNCYFRILWSWGGQAKVSVGSSNLVHTAEQEQHWVQKAREAEDDDDDDDDDDSEFGTDFIAQLLGTPKDPESVIEHVPAGERIDLSDAVIVASSAKTTHVKAADMLRDEIKKRTRIGLDVASKMPGPDKVAIAIGTAGELADISYQPAAGSKVPSKADAYAVWIDRSKRDAATVCLAGYDDRAVLYAAGRLLRELEMSRDKLELDVNLRVATAPKYPLRGHQIGYRPKTNAYDAWDIKMWEQYFRDIIAFGANAVEFVPPESDDSDDSPHFPKPKLEMMIAMSQLADDYDLDVWIWYPVVDDDDLDAKAIAKALKVREAVFKKLPRIDTIFVPGGDPGEVYPDQLFALMKSLKKVLNKYHPDAQMWVSPQGFDFEGDAPGYLKAFYEQMAKEPAWLDGVVFGPQVADNLKVLREKLPSQYPIRRYPDITHCLDAQYSVPDWDPAYHVTLYREPINPRPMGYAKIFRDWDQYTVGFITYSEGVNDDVNKFIWACLGWDPEMKVEDILKDYSKYFISGRYAEKFAEGLLALERNWQGPLLTNVGVYETLKMFQQMEKDATPQEKLNWRFQLALYRAYYDAYTRRRLIYETELEEKAMDILRNAEQLGSLSAMNKAEAILDRTEKERVADDWRARTFEMAEALFQSIRMQLSVVRYEAKSERRGGNLDLIDTPLNDSRRLKKIFSKIRRLESERARLAAIARITAERYLMKLQHDRKVILDGIN
jgi:hypothetical protein